MTKQVNSVKPINVDAGSRTITFVASDESVDRYGDIVRVRGWKLANYLKNPVLLWAHDAKELPIGTVSSLEISGTRLIARAVFAPEGVTAFADDAWSLVAAGILRAVSVGFLPLEEPVIRRDAEGTYLGRDFANQELLELSLVAVPANSNAVAIGKAQVLPPDVARQLADNQRRIDALLAGA